MHALFGLFCATVAFVANGLAVCPERTSQIWEGTRWRYKAFITVTVHLFERRIPTTTWCGNDSHANA